jgi:hypothetical protein
VLVQAYHNLNDFAGSSIETYLKKLLLHRGRPTKQHWADFYFQTDMIDTSTSGRWLSMKEIGPESTKVGVSFLALNVEGTHRF